MDNLRGTYNTVAFGFSHLIYHGGADPHPARNCHNSSAGAYHSRTEAAVGPASDLGSLSGLGRKRGVPR